MDVALHCAYCGSPSSGTGFCASCGAGLPAAPVVPAPREAHEQVTAIPVLARTETPAPWVARADPTLPPRRTDRLVLLAVVALLLSGYWLVWGLERHTVSGTVVLLDSTYARTTPGTACAGRGADADVEGGARASFVDGDGETVSSARLSDGTVDGVGCVFTFTLDGVPRADDYRLVVGDSTRGTYSYDDLRGDDWSVELSLGRSR